MKRSIVGRGTKGSKQPGSVQVQESNESAAEPVVEVFDIQPFDFPEELGPSWNKWKAVLDEAREYCR